MGLKEEFLKIATLEEWEKRSKDFKDLKIDNEVLDHLDKLLGKGYAGDLELHSKGSKGMIGN